MAGEAFSDGYSFSDGYGWDWSNPVTITLGQTSTTSAIGVGTYPEAATLSQESSVSVEVQASDFYDSAALSHSGTMLSLRYADLLESAGVAVGRDFAALPRRDLLDSVGPYGLSSARDESSDITHLDHVTSAALSPGRDIGSTGLTDIEGAVSLERSYFGWQYGRVRYRDAVTHGRLGGASSLAITAVLSAASAQQGRSDSETNAVALLEDVSEAAQRDGGYAAVATVGSASELPGGRADATTAQAAVDEDASLSAGADVAQQALQALTETASETLGSDLATPTSLAALSEDVSEASQLDGDYAAVAALDESSELSGGLSDATTAQAAVDEATSLSQETDLSLEGLQALTESASESLGHAMSDPTNEVASVAAITISPQLDAGTTAVAALDVASSIALGRDIDIASILSSIVRAAFLYQGGAVAGSNEATFVASSSIERGVDISGDGLAALSSAAALDLGRDLSAAQLGALLESSSLSQGSLLGAPTNEVAAIAALALAGGADLTAAETSAALGALSLTVGRDTAQTNEATMLGSLSLDVSLDSAATNVAAFVPQIALSGALGMSYTDALSGITDSVALSRLYYLTSLRYGSFRRSVALTTHRRSVSGAGYIHALASAALESAPSFVALRVGALDETVSIGRAASVEALKSVTIAVHSALGQGRDLSTPTPTAVFYASSLLDIETSFGREAAIRVGELVELAARTGLIQVIEFLYDHIIWQVYVGAPTVANAMTAHTVSQAVRVGEPSVVSPVVGVPSSQEVRVGEPMILKVAIK
jgi:hypothetical protein